MPLVCPYEPFVVSAAPDFVVWRHPSVEHRLWAEFLGAHRSLVRLYLGVRTESWASGLLTGQAAPSFGEQQTSVFRVLPVLESLWVQASRA